MEKKQKLPSDGHHDTDTTKDQHRHFTIREFNSLATTVEAFKLRRLENNAIFALMPDGSILLLPVQELNLGPNYGIGEPAYLPMSYPNMTSPVLRHKFKPWLKEILEPLRAETIIWHKQYSDAGKDLALVVAHSLDLGGLFFPYFHLSWIWEARLKTASNLPWQQSHGCHCQGDDFIISPIISLRFIHGR